MMADDEDLVVACVDEQDFPAFVEIRRQCLVEQQQYVVLVQLLYIAHSVSLVEGVDLMVM